MNSKFIVINNNLEDKMENQEINISKKEFNEIMVKNLGLNLLKEAYKNDVLWDEWDTITAIITDALYEVNEYPETAGTYFDNRMTVNLEAQENIDFIKSNSDLEIVKIGNMKHVELVNNKKLYDEILFESEDYYNGFDNVCSLFDSCNKK